MHNKIFKRVTAVTLILCSLSSTVVNAGTTYNDSGTIYRSILGFNKGASFRKSDTQSDATEVADTGDIVDSVDTRANNAATTDFSLTKDYAKEVPGYFDFEQQHVQATAQVKGGSGLKGTYDALTGIPTTEKLGITYGGSHYLLSMQYTRRVAPYNRTLHFKAKPTKNYTYLNLGNVAAVKREGDYEYNYNIADYDYAAVHNSDNKYNDIIAIRNNAGSTDSGTQQSVNYWASTEISNEMAGKRRDPLNDNDNDDLGSARTDEDDIADSYLNPAYPSSGVNVLYNYGYVYFEQSLERKQNPSMGVNHDSRYRNTEDDAVPLWYDGTNAPRANITQIGNQPSYWDYCNVLDKHAEVSGKTWSSEDSEDVHGTEDSTYFMPPDVARAVLLKQEVMSSIFELASTMSTNHGSGDTYGLSYKNNHKADLAEGAEGYVNTMYTYGGMLVPDKNTPDKVSREKFSGDSADRDVKVPNVEKLWTANIAGFQTDCVADADDNYSKPKNVIYHTNLNDYVTDINNASAINSARVFSDLSVSDRAVIDKTFKVSSILQKRLNNAHNNRGCAINPWVGFYDSEGIVDFNGDWTGTKHEYPAAGFYLRNKNEFGYLWYRAMYNLFLEWSPYFYYDEAKMLFSGIPGFNANINNASAIREYNSYVRENLRAVFGIAWNEGFSKYDVSSGSYTNNEVITIPFATFPPGGNLDSTFSEDNNINIDKTTVHAAHKPNYTYKIDMTIGLHNTVWPVDQEGVLGSNTPKYANKNWRDSTDSASAPYDMTANGHDKGPFEDYYTIVTWHNLDIKPGHWVGDYMYQDSDGNYKLEETNATMSATYDITQHFNNVEWLDITSIKLYQMDSGTATGLGELVDSDSDKIITEAVKKMGYNVLDIDDYQLGQQQSEYTSDSTNDSIIYEKPIKNLEVDVGRVENSFYIQEGVDVLANSPRCKTSRLCYKYVSDSAHAPITAYSIADVPTVGCKNEKYGNRAYINGDASAFYVDMNNIADNTDDLFFEYDAYTQGGRSKESYYNFVKQALAHSLLAPVSFCDGSTGCSVVTKEGVKRAYTNTLAIQGDYLTLKRPANYDDDLAIAGSVYDTWFETTNVSSDKQAFDSAISAEGTYAYNLGKSSLIQAETLRKYYSTSAWIPENDYYVCSRVSTPDGTVRTHSALPSGFKNNKQSSAYLYTALCNVINKDVYSKFDDWSACNTCKNIHGGSVCPTIAKWRYSERTDLGDVTTDPYGSGAVTWAVSLIGSAVGSDSYAHNTDVLNTDGAKLSDTSRVENEIKDKVSGNVHYTLVNNLTVDYLVRNDKNIVERFWTGTSSMPYNNNRLFMNYSRCTDFEMPYIGYQSQGCDTKDIVISDVLSDAATMQVGYYPGTRTLFDPDKTTMQNTTGHAHVKNKLSEDSVSTPATEMYPNIGNLSIKDNLPNGEYTTGNAYVKYTEVYRMYNHTSVGSSVKLTTSGSTVNVPAHYLYQQDFQTNNYSVAPSGWRNEGNDYRNPNNGGPNNIVIFNPIATTSAHIAFLNDSTKQPDAKNNNVTDHPVESDSRVEYKSTIDDLSEVVEFDKLDEREVKTVRATMRDVSELDTKPLTDVSAYKYTIDTRDMIVASGDEIPIKESGWYKIEFNHKPDVGNQARTYKYRLNKGDTLLRKQTSDGYQLWVRPLNNNILKSEDFIEAYEVFKTTLPQSALRDAVLPAESQSFELPAGSKLYFDLTNTKLKKDEVVSIAFNASQPDDSIVSDPDKFSVTFGTNNVNTMNVRPNQTDTQSLVYLAQAINDCNLGYVCIECTEDMRITPSSFLMVKSDIPLAFPPTGAYSSPLYRDPMKILSSNRSTDYYADDSMTLSYTSSNDFSATYLPVRTDGVSVQLYDKDPHTVPSAYWRYYVLGYRWADDLSLITDINDNKFNDKSNAILVPTGASIAVGTFEASGSPLYVYQDTTGKYGLTHNFDVSSGEVTSDITGYVGPANTIEFFDDSSLGGLPSQYLSQIPESFRKDSSSIPIDDKGTQQNQCKCSVIFKASDVADSIAYSVKASKNSAHRFASNDGNRSLCEKDWEFKTDTVQPYSLKGDSDNNIIAKNISLDDEFVVYWDNLTELKADEHTDFINTRSLLGRGWRTHDNASASDSLTPAAPEDCNAQSTPPTVYDKPFWQNYGTEDKNIFDCTTWIKDKCVVFNFDVYMSTNEKDVGKPIYNNSDPKGKNRALKLVKANTPIPLGKRTSEGFEDYGAGSDYEYHFWCPAYVGEADRTACAQFYVTAINDEDKPQHQLDSTDTCASSLTQIANPVASEDEFGFDVNRIVGATISNNEFGISSSKDTDEGIVYEPCHTFRRYTSICNSTSFDIVGRVGALTILNSGDPRFQDSFKVGDSEKYAIFPIVHAVDSYSTTKGEIGSQSQYLTDKYDLRGRKITKDTYTDKSITYSPMKFFEKASGSGTLSRYDLPLGSGFNKHDAYNDFNGPICFKLGYPLQCSVSTIGNYYGTSAPRSDTDTPVNGSGDCGNTKVTLRPIYFAVNGKTGDCTPVDIYGKFNNSYELINTADDNKWKEVALTSKYVMSLDTKGGQARKDIKKRSITESTDANNSFKDIDSTFNPWLHKGIKCNIFDEFNTTNGDDVTFANQNHEYIYGNAQELHLRERNRVFAGGKTPALQGDVDTSNSYTDSKASTLTVQDWHFDLQLPSNAAIVGQGKACSSKNREEITDNYDYLLCAVSVIAIGEKWSVAYIAPECGEPITMPNGRNTLRNWNRGHRNLVPVAFFDLGASTSAGDKTTQGTH